MLILEAIYLNHIQNSRGEFLPNYSNLSSPFFQNISILFHFLNSILYVISIFFKMSARIFLKCDCFSFLHHLLPRGSLLLISHSHNNHDAVLNCITYNGLQFLNSLLSHKYVIFCCLHVQDSCRKYQVPTLKVRNSTRIDSNYSYSSNNLNYKYFSIKALILY